MYIYILCVYIFLCIYIYVYVYITRSGGCNTRFWRVSIHVESNMFSGKNIFFALVEKNNTERRLARFALSGEFFSRPFSFL